MEKFRKKHGTFAKRAGGTAVDPARSEAVVEAMVIAACIDGILAPGEAEALAALILDTPGFSGLDNRGLARMVEQVADRVARDGLEARVRAIATGLGESTEAREEAFMLATLFVHYDGEVGDEEQAYIDMLQAELAISDERASDIDARLTELTSAGEGN